MGFLTPLIVFVGYYAASKLVDHLISNNSRSLTLLSHLLEYEDTIVGGNNATIEDYPHQVFFTFARGDKRYECGGFIISQNYILTAAHCIKGINASTIELSAGSTWRDGDIIPIAEVIAHPDYTHHDKDVGLLKTVYPIEFTNTTQPIELVSKGKHMTDGSMVTVTGWGSTIENGEDSKHLLAVEVPVVNHSQCKEAYENVHIEVTRNMWCAGYYNTGGKDSCNGDSGGAAVQNSLAVGIVSFGYGCARPHYPGVYTDIAAPAIRDFIKEHTGM